MLEKINVEDAVGTVLAHDITEVRANREFKGRAFKKGHVITQDDICKLLSLGKERLYVLKINDDEVHENEAGERIARAIAGQGVILSGEVREGKVSLYAAHDGLLKGDVAGVEQLNRLDDLMCATRHTNSLVRKGDLLAGTRAIPLLIKRSIVEEAEARARRSGNVVEVLPLRSAKVGVVITGNEVYKGRIKDAFEPVVRQKIADIGSEIITITFAPDDESFIADAIKDLVARGADLIVTTGGMSVDPDDVTPTGIRKAGATITAYGSSVLPGAMFLMGYLGDIPIMGVPACGMYPRTTIFALLLPRVLAGEKIGRPEIAKLGHGGLCLDCPECEYPHCGFGKGA